MSTRSMIHIIYTSALVIMYHNVRKYRAMYAQTLEYREQQTLSTVPNSVAGELL